MEKLKNFLNTIEYDFTKNKVKSSFIPDIDKECGLKMGKQLTEYILTYGYIGYQHIEFYGVNSNQGLGSDLVQQTLYLHKYFNETLNFFAFSNEGDGEYLLIDANDRIFKFDSDTKKITPTDTLLEDFLIAYLGQIED